jgi:hypothetical protein
MGKPDKVTERGTTVIPNIREFWPTLTEEDIQAMNKWRWSACRHQDPRKQYGIAREEIFNTLVSYPHLLGERAVVR